jgi:uncharacterized delta-60 repeat protein
LISETPSASLSIAGYNPALSAVPLIGGGFVVVFADGSSGQPSNLDGPSDMGVRFQIYDDDGNLVGAPTRVVNTVTAGSQFTSTCAPLANGGFIVSWIDQNPNQVGRVRRFNATGVALDPVELSVHQQGTDAPSFASGSVQVPNCALLADGSVAIFYRINVVNQAYVLRMDPEGNFVDKPGGLAGQKQISVSTDTSTGGFVPFVVPLSSGGFFTFFQTQNGGTTSRAASYRLFDSNFNVGPVVNLEVVGNSAPYPFGTALQGGGFLLGHAIFSAPPNYSYGVFDNAFAGPTPPAGFTTVAVTQTAFTLTPALAFSLQSGGFAYKWLAGPTSTIRNLYVKSYPSASAVPVSPTIASVSGPSAGISKAGQTLSFTVTFSAAVTVTGTPKLALTIGGVPVLASYASGSGTTALVFTYTVQAGDNGLAAITAPLQLPGGALIRNGAGVDATLTFTPPTLTGVNVDTTAPTVTISAPSPLFTSTGPVTYTVTYADANFSSATLSAGNITLTGTATAGSVAVTGAGSTRTVTLSNISGNGTLGFNLAAGTAADTAGNLALAATSPIGFVPNAAPVVTLLTNAVVATGSGVLVYGDGVARSVPAFATFSPGPANEVAQTLVGYTLTADNPALFSVAPAINNAGTLTFTPARTNGATRVVVVAQDNGGTANGGVDATTNVFTVVVQTAPGTVDPTLSTTVDTAVNAVAVQADGKILLGGTFTMVNGTARNRVARLLADGALDTTFNPGADGTVNAIVVGTDGAIYLAGAFTTVAGTGRLGLAKLLPDGTLDATFTTESSTSGAAGLVLCLALQADGRLLAGGQFSSGLTGGSAPYLARLNLNGTVDSAFNPVVDNSILTIQPQPDGKLVVSGVFTTVGGQPRARLARLNADGTLDASFTADADNNVVALALAADGKMWLGGAFVNVGGQARARLARLLPNGSVDAGFNPGADGVVRTLAAQADGRVLIGGAFTTVGGQSRSRLARLMADGSVDPTFRADANNTVNGLGVSRDGRVVAVGNFTSVDGQPNTTRVARLLNEPATEALTASGGTQVTWQRAGSAPEAEAVRFELSVDAGATWSALGNGTRVAGGWQLSGLTLPGNGLLRGRAQVRSGERGSSGGLVETVATIVNTVPSAGSALAAVNLNAGTPVATVALPPAFADAEQSAATLTYSVTGNTNFAVVVAEISGGTNLVLTPVAGLPGTSLVTVRATDVGGLFLERTVLVTVTVNQAPMVSFAQGVLAVAGTLTGPQTVAGFATLAAGGATESGQVLTPSVTTDNAGLFSAAPTVAANGTLTYTLASGASGNAVVTVVVMDSGGTALGGRDRTTNTFRLSVVPASLVVTSTADSGPGSLRQVIANANAMGSPVTILFAPGAGITPTTPLPAFTGPVTLAGSGALPPLSVGAGGTLSLGGGAFSGTTINVGSGGTVMGSGTFAGTLTVSPGGTVSPGASPGQLTVDAGEWAAGAFYEWEINDATGVAGTASDLLAFTGQLSITATAGSPFTVKMKTLTAENAPGPMANFDAMVSQSWTIAQAGMVAGFDLAALQLDTTGVANAASAGTFGLRLVGGAVQVTYTVNTAPTVANAPAPVNVLEEAGNTVVQLRTSSPTRRSRPAG